MTFPTTQLRCTYHRLVNSAYPPIDLFEDIADPADWELLAIAESRTNPRISETIGNLDLVPVERRVSGQGASYVMAPFVHASIDRPGRFHDGTFGAFYGADSYEAALFETVHHTETFCAATAETSGWIADMRELIGTINAEMTDLTGGGANTLLDPAHYSAPQAFAKKLMQNGGDGIVYPSVRYPGGTCFAAFYPNVPGIPKQGRHLRYHWDGTRIDMIKDISDGNKVYALE